MYGIESKELLVIMQSHYRRRHRQRQLLSAGIKSCLLGQLLGEGCTEYSLCACIFTVSLRSTAYVRSIVLYGAHNKSTPRTFCAILNAISFPCISGVIPNRHSAISMHLK